MSIVYVECCFLNDSFLISIRWKSETKSNVVEYWPNLANKSVVFGSGYLPLIVLSFNFLYPKRLVSFLLSRLERTI